MDRPVCDPDRRPRSPEPLVTTRLSCGEASEEPDSLSVLFSFSTDRSEDILSTRLANRYEVAAELGRGGMGVVYRARDPILNREVAVKLIGSAELTAEIEERFQREAQIVAQMDHPGIVPVHDLGRHEGSLFFVMPLVEGTNLRRLIYDRSLRLGEVLDVGIQVAEALDYSHARGVVHRDIKPENVMVVREEGGSVRVRVMDFGLVHASTENRLTKTGTLIGTVSYLSPEQVTATPSMGVPTSIHSASCSTSA